MSNTKILSPGEIAKGQMITIFEWLPYEVPDIGDGIEGLLSSLGGATTKTHQDHSWCGNVLKVEAVDLPYIMVSHPNETYLYSGRNTSIDTRRVTLMELSKEYIDASVKQPKS